MKTKGSYQQCHDRMANDKMRGANEDAMESAELGLCEEVRQALHWLPFSAYLALVRQLLIGSGYSSVRSAGGGKEHGSLSIGGFDLIAFCHTDFTTGLTAVQIKQPRAEVKRRFVDELRGAMARHGVEQGLIVTTGRFSAAAHEAAQGLTILPVRLVDGEELATMLIERGVGICITSLPERPGQSVGWGVDAAYFENLVPKGRRAIMSENCSSDTAVYRCCRTKRGTGRARNPLKSHCFGSLSESL